MRRTKDAEMYGYEITKGMLTCRETPYVFHTKEEARVAGEATLMEYPETPDGECCLVMRVI